jgi:hypothetical protein
LELLSFDPDSVGSAILEVDDHQPDPTGVANQLLRIKGLLSAPIDALVQDSDAVRDQVSTLGSPSDQALANRTPPFISGKGGTGSAKN